VSGELYSPFASSLRKITLYLSHKLNWLKSQSGSLGREKISLTLLGIAVFFGVVQPVA
jgi:hypothetical protein